MGLFDRIFGDSDDGDTEAEGGAGTDPEEGTAVEEMTPEDFREHAEDFVAEQPDYDLDFSVASLAALDSFAAEQSSFLRALAEDSDSLEEVTEQALGMYTIQAGSYFGEVVRRECGGNWQYEGGWVVTLADREGEVPAVSVFDVAAKSFAGEPVFVSILDDIEQIDLDDVDFDAPNAPASDEMSVAADADTQTSAETPDDSDTGGESPDDRAFEIVDTAEPIEDKRAQLIEEAEELSKYWHEHQLDYTPESLQRLDSFVDQQWDKDRFSDATLTEHPDHIDDSVYTGVVLQLGAYFGEVLVRNYDAEWTESDTMGRQVVTLSPPESADDSDSMEVNVFHVAQDCLTEPSKFEMVHDTTLSELDESG